MKDFEFDFHVSPTNPELEAVTPRTIRSKISFLRSYFDKIENNLQEESELLWQECERENQRTKDHEDDSEYDYRASDSLRDIEYIYLRMHRYSATLASYAYFESSMNKLCHDFKVSMNISKGIKSLKTGRISLLDAYQEYFTRYVGVGFEEISRQWGHLIELNTLRNCIIHSDGDANTSNSQVLNAVKNRDDLSFIEENLIMVSASFIHSSLDNIESVLLHLVSHGK